MILNPYMVISLFVLCMYFPSLKCLIIVDDVRWYKRLKDGYFKTLTWDTFIPQRLYSGGTFFSFEDCPSCDKGQVHLKTGDQKCPRCKGDGRIEWQRKVFGKLITGIQIDHAFSVALMLIICSLMYADFHSIWAVLLFASSSMSTHIAVWLNGRRYAVNIIIVLLMIACFNAGGWWALLALPLYASTPLFHMTAVFAPVIYPISIPLIVLVVALFWNDIHNKVMARLNSIFECDRKYWRWAKIIIIVKTYGFYFFKMLFPMMTRTCYGFLYTWGETPEGNKDAYKINVAFFKGVLSILLTGIGIWFLPAHYKMYGIFMALSLLQWCNIINATQVTSDRYACLPNVFMSVFVAYFLSIVPHGHVVTSIIVACNIVFVSYSYRMYENVQGMFDYHFYHWPNITLVNKEYVSFCIRTGNYIKAYTIVRECLRFNPTDFALLHAAAVCARVANERATARQYCDIAEKHLYYGQEETQKKWLDNFRRSL